VKCLQIEQKYADIRVLHLAQVWASRLIFTQLFERIMHMIKHTKSINDKTALTLGNSNLQHNFFLASCIIIIMNSTVITGREEAFRISNPCFTRKRQIVRESKFSKSCPSLTPSSLPFPSSTKRERDLFLPMSKAHVEDISVLAFIVIANGLSILSSLKFEEINKFISYISIYLDLLSIYQDMS